MRLFLLLLSSLFVLSACSEDKPAESEAADQTVEGLADPQQVYLDSYAARDDVIKRDSGLLYRVLETGDGATPEPGQMVRVHYRGSFIDGAVFDSSYDRGEPAEFPSDRLIKGWVEALGLMQEGDKWELVVPAELGYGLNGRGPIPGGATLVFQVELIKVLEEGEPAQGTE